MNNKALEEIFKIYEIFKILIKMITLTYWKNESHCGGDFDENGCKECYSFQMCKNETEIKALMN